MIPRATRGRCGHAAAHQPPRRAATAPLGTVSPTEHSLLRLARATHRSPLAHSAVYTGSRRSFPQGGARRGSPALPAASVRCSAGGLPPAPLAASPALQAFWGQFCVLRVTGPWKLDVPTICWSLHRSGRLSCFSFLPEGSLPLSCSFSLAVKNRDLIWGFCPLEEMLLGALEHWCRCPQTLFPGHPHRHLWFDASGAELGTRSQQSALPAVTISAPLP